MIEVISCYDLLWHCMLTARTFIISLTIAKGKAQTTL